MAPLSDKSVVKLALPKGRMQEEVFKLLSDAGIKINTGSRAYRPTISLPGFEVKILKPQNIVEMLHLGSRDLGFAGADWVDELGVELECILDTALDPVRLVAAAPEEILVDGQLPKTPLLIASEYEQLTKRWIERKGLNATVIRSYGATEVFPPEDADCIVDNTATGATLLANNLAIVDELMVSSTRLYANPKILKNPEVKDQIDRFVLLVRSVLEARKRVMIEVNVVKEKLDGVAAILPCMREPTISLLHGDAGYVVRAAVPKNDLIRLIPEIKARGGTDIVVTEFSQIIP